MTGHIIKVMNSSIIINTISHLSNVGFVSYFSTQPLGLGSPSPCDPAQEEATMRAQAECSPPNPYEDLAMLYFHMFSKWSYFMHQMRDELHETKSIGGLTELAFPSAQVCTISKKVFLFFLFFHATDDSV